LGIIERIDYLDYQIYPPLNPAETVKIDLPVNLSRNWEDSITFHFYSAIISEKSRRKQNGHQFAFDFTLFASVFDETQVSDGLPDYGIPDIQITFRSDEAQRYFFEAKLLNKEGEYLHNQYVSQGMMCFITGKYGKSVQWSGMIGYVLDGNTNKARNKVAMKIENERLTLGMSPTATLNISTIRKDVYETLHMRQTMTPFTIYHVFLPVQRGR